MLEFSKFQGYRVRVNANSLKQQHACLLEARKLYFTLLNGQKDFL